MIGEPFDGVDVPPLPVADGSVSPADLRELAQLFGAARQPLVVTGGNEWSAAGAAAMTAWVERAGIPALSQWRSPGVVPSDSPVFAGTLGYRRSGTAAAALDDADLLLSVGAVLADVDTDGYTLRQRPDARTVIVSIDAARTGHAGPVARHILARPDVFATVLADLEIEPRPDWKPWRQGLREAQERDRRSTLMDAATFTKKIRSAEPAVGYRVVSDSPVATERIAHLDYDFVCLDAQHGLIGFWHRASPW